MRRRTPTTIGPAPVGSSDLCCTLPAPSLLVAGPVTGYYWLLLPVHGAP